MMIPYLADPDVTLYRGDALDVLRELPDGSVHMCATSPPFYGLRDYGVEGQIGLEESPQEWVARLVAVFREVRRVLLAGSPEGGVVLDPFAGSGTTLLVARHQGRRSIGIELNADYCKLAADRLAQQSLLAENVG